MKLSILRTYSVSILVDAYCYHAAHRSVCLTVEGGDFHICTFSYFIIVLHFTNFQNNSVIDYTIISVIDTYSDTVMSSATHGRRTTFCHQ